jgi:hypothetical protein
MLKKMFTGRKRVPFMQENLRGDSELEQDDGGRETKSPEPTRTTQVLNKYNLNDVYVRPNAYISDTWHINLSEGSDSTFGTIEDLQDLKKILNSMEELN